MEYKIPIRYTSARRDQVEMISPTWGSLQYRSLKKGLTIILGVFLFFFGVGLITSQSIQGADTAELDVKPELGIRILENNPTTRFAAQELARYLAIMSNNTGIAEIEVFGQNTWPKNKPTLTLGLFDDLSVKMDGIADPAIDDAVCVEVKNSNGFIAGSNPRSILFAVYRFLEANGCVWIRPGKCGDYVPTCDVHKLSASIRDKAFYHFRGFSNCGGHTCDDMIDRIAWMPKVGLNTFFHEFMLPRMQYDIYLKHGYPSLKPPEERTDEEIRAYFELSIREAKKRGLSYHAAGHGWTALVVGAPESQSDHFARPEPQPDKVKYLAKINGSRNLKDGPTFTDICHGNPDAQKRFARCVADYAEDHPEVDYLHVWLDDRSNDTCECERCVDPVIADAYVRLLNLIDAELTRRKIDMKIVFIAYHETMWRPVHERFKHIERFSMLFAPISRNYNVPYPTKAPDVDVKPYVKNKFTAPRDVSTNVGLLKRWQEIFPKKAFVYEYHMWQHHYTDLGYFEFARIMGEDIKRMRYIGLDGFVSCMVGRANFPDGFPMNVHARLLWNPDQDFDTLAREYFRTAFGKDYQLVLDYVRALSTHSVYTAKAPAKEQQKEFVEKLSTVGPVFDSFRPVIAEHLKTDMPTAIHDSWKYLMLHNEIYSLYAQALLAQAQDKSADEIQTRWQAMVNKIAWTEDETRPVFDLYKFYSRLYTAKKLKPGPKPESGSQP